MNTLFKNLTLFFIFIVSIEQSHAQWTTVSTGTTEDLFSVDYYSQTVIWIGSNSRYITTNTNGAIWSVNYPMYDTFNAQIFGQMLDVKVTGTNTVFCTGLYYLGNNEVIFTTNNGGTNWDLASNNNSVGLPRFLTALDKSGINCIAVGNNGRIARSINLGSTWNFVASGTSELIYDVKYFSTDTLIAVGYDVILKSVNGGLNWSVMNEPGYHHSVSGIHNVIYVGDEYEESLLKSVDYGSTYTPMTLPFMSNGVLTAISEDTVLAAGQEGLYISVSGGQYWEQFILPGYKKVNMFDFIDHSSGFAVGDTGFAIRTTNLANTPAIPVVSFEIQGGATNFCLGDSITLLNGTAPIPGYLYEWKLDNITFSTQYNAGIVLTSDGSHNISLTVTNANGSAVTEQQVNVTGHVLLPFSFVNISPTVCSNSHAAFLIPNSQSGVSYSFRDGYTTIGVAQNGNGGTLSFATPSGITVTTGFNLIGVHTNFCFTDSIIYYDTVYVTTPTLTPACIPTGNNGTGITNVTFNTINNSTSASMGTYNDFSCLMNTNLVVGTTTSISITPTYIGYVKVWIDLDSNHVFNSTNEVVMSGWTPNTTYTGNIIIPVTHQLFNVPLRMRVAFDPNLSDLNSPCNSGGSGEYEDYSVTVINAPGLPVASFTTSLTTVCNTSVVFTNTTFNATSYQWDFGDGNTSTVLNPTHIYTATGVYTVTLISTNALGSDTITQAINIQNPQLPVAPACNPIENILSCDNKEILSFQLNGEYVNSGSNNFYEDFTCTFQVHLTRDSNYVMGYSVRDQVTSSCTGHSCAWIDYDNNGVFNDSTERLINGTMLGCPVVWVYFTVPSTAVVNVPLRIRVMASEGGFSNSCSLICGQYEEYTAFIDPYPFMNVGFTASQTTTCVGSVINFNNTTVNATSYSWDFGDGNTSTQMNPSHAYTAIGTYTVQLIACNSAGNCDTVSMPNYINILPGTNLQITSLSTTSFCRGDSAILVAQPGFATYQWYRYLLPINGADSMYYTVKVAGKYKCIVQDSVSCIDTSNIIKIMVPCIPIGPNNERTLQIDESSSAAIYIYPNPGNGLFTVASDPGTLEVFNTLGKLIYSKELIESNNSFDISEFPDGIYLVNLRTAAGLQTQKIVLLR